MPHYTSRELALKAGIPYITLQEWIRTRKLGTPKFVRHGVRLKQVWTQSDLKFILWFRGQLESTPRKAPKKSSVLRGHHGSDRPRAIPEVLKKSPHHKLSSEGGKMIKRATVHADRREFD